MLETVIFLNTERANSGHIAGEEPLGRNLLVRENLVSLVLVREIWSDSCLEHGTNASGSHVFSSLSTTCWTCLGWLGAHA